MIVELFGPPCVGKTTLAGAVAARLREHGRGVELVLSYRPAEYPSGSAAEGEARPRIPAALSRLARPMIESFAAIGHSADPGETRAAAELMRLLALRNPVHSLRLRQYLLRLSRTWRAAAAADDVVLFDQGFVQAVCTCAVLARAADPERIGRALDAVPEADLLVRLDAPAEILDARLAERRRHQGRIEQLFDAWTNLGSIWIFDQLHELLRARGRPVIRVTSSDRHLLDNSVDKVAAIIVGIPGKILAGSGLGRNDTGC
jgi:thymidylate kinase